MCKVELRSLLKKKYSMMSARSLREVDEVA
jgi:hypothetical protein